MFKKCIKTELYIIMTLLLCFCALNAVTYCTGQNVPCIYSTCPANNDAEQTVDLPAPTAVEPCLHNIQRALYEHSVLAEQHSVSGFNGIVLNTNITSEAYNTPFECFSVVSRQVILKLNE